MFVVTLLKYKVAKLYDFFHRGEGVYVGGIRMFLLCRSADGKFKCRRINTLSNAVRSSAARALRAAFYLDWRTEWCYFRGRHWPRLSDIGHPLQPETQPQLLYCATFPKPESPDMETSHTSSGFPQIGSHNHPSVKLLILSFCS